MIKLFSVKQKQKEAAESANGRAPVKKQSPGELRVQKDISELNLAKTTSISFPNGKDNLLNFEITIRPDEGYYQGGTFVFTFQISQVYPHEAPKVKCKTKVYHPNIDLEGNVCLNILREDWNPVLSVNSIIYGLQYLFLDPNPDDPLNHEAAEVLRDNPRQFENNVRRSMAGGYVGVGVINNQWRRTGYFDLATCHGFDSCCHPSPVHHPSSSPYPFTRFVNLQVAGKGRPSNIIVEKVYIVVDTTA